MTSSRLQRFCSLCSFQFSPSLHPLIFYWMFILDLHWERTESPIELSASSDFLTPLAGTARCKIHRKHFLLYMPIIPNDIIPIRDFVDYSQPSDSPAFPSLEQMITSLHYRSSLAYRKTHLNFRPVPGARICVTRSWGRKKINQVEHLLANRYTSKGGRLYQAVENFSTTFTRQTEEAHIRQLVDKALPFILPPKEQNSKTLRIVIREILACSVLYPIIEMVTDLDFWNKTIDQVVSMFAK